MVQINKSIHGLDGQGNIHTTVSVDKKKEGYINLKLYSINGLLSRLPNSE